MIRISGPRISDVVSAVDGKEINGIMYTYTGNTVGIQATFTTDAENEELAKDNIKKYLKQILPVLKIYVEVI